MLPGSGWHTAEDGVGVEWAILSGLSGEDRRLVLGQARRRRFARNEVVFHEGDPGDSLHLLAGGRAAVRVTTPLGDVATFTVLGPGDTFGEGALLAPDAIRTASVVALERTETLSLHRDAFEQLRATHRSVDRMLIDVLAAQVRRLSAHLLEAMYVPTETRLFRRLVELVDAYGPGPAAGPVTIPLTQEDLAGLVGTTRPTVNQVLKAAEDDGFLHTERGRVVIDDPERLRRRAG